MTNNIRSLALSIAAAALLAGGWSAVASGDVGGGNPVGIGFGAHPVLRPVLHATVASDSGAYHFTAKGYFKIGTKTVARLASFSGTSSTTLARINLKVSTFERHNIRAAARHHHAKRTTLTIVTRVELPNDSSPKTYTADAFLTIPRN